MCVCKGATFTLGWWHSPNDIGWKARNVPVSAGLKPLHFITAQCFTALYVTRQWYSDSQASKCAAPAPNVRLGFVPEREREGERRRERERERDIKRERERERNPGWKIEVCCKGWHGAAPMLLSQQKQNCSQTTQPAAVCWLLSIPSFWGLWCGFPLSWLMTTLIKRNQMPKSLIACSNVPQRAARVCVISWTACW